MENKPHYIPRVAGAPQPQPQQQQHPQSQSEPQPKSGGGSFRALAHYCWLSVLLVVALALVLSAMKPAQWIETSPVANVALWLLRISGVVSGIIALFGVRFHGRKGILIPALVGLSLWLLMIGLAALAFPTFQNIQMRVMNLKTAAGSSSSSGASSSASSESKYVSSTQTPPVYPPGSTRVEDKELGFSFAVPEGYVVLSEKGPDDRHAFKRRLMTEPPRGILIKKMKGDYSRRIATAEDLPAPPAGHTISSVTFNWRGRDVGGSRSLDPRLAQPFVVFRIVIPLRKETILLEVGGAQESEPVIREVVEQVLGSLAEE